MATTLSLLAVFLPVGFMGGIVGRFMSSFGFTSAFAIAVSLLVSFTLTPMLCSRYIKAPQARCSPAIRPAGKPRKIRGSSTFLDLLLHADASLVYVAPSRIILGLCVLNDNQHRAAVHVCWQELSSVGRSIAIQCADPNS